MGLGPTSISLGFESLARLADAITENYITERIFRGHGSGEFSCAHCDEREGLGHKEDCVVLLAEAIQRSDVEIVLKIG